MFYGAVVWDPWLIVAQIVCLQCLYYVTLGVFMSILVGTRVSRMSLMYFFDYATVTASTVTGWCVIASFLLSAFAGAGYMLYLIERAKKCLDFSATLYIVHLFICIVYGGWPSSITWWVVNGTGIAVMALLGEYLCIRRELREIPITRYRSEVEQQVNHFPKEKLDVVEDVLDVKEVNSKRGNQYRRFLEKWLGKPAIESTWIAEEELMKIDPEIYAEVVQTFSPEPSFSPPGRIDAGASKLQPSSKRAY